MQEKCTELDALSSDPLVELGFCYMMIERYDKAYQFFTDATNFNSMSMVPSIGMVRCQIHKGELEDAESQLEFLKEMSSSMGGRVAAVAFLEGMLQGRRNTGREEFSKMEAKLKDSNRALDEALSLHIKHTKKMPHNLKYYIEIDSDFLISLTNEFLYHADFSLSQIKERIQNPTTPSHLVKKANQLVNIALKKIPGLIPGYMLAAKSKIIMGDLNSAIQSLQQSLELDPKNEEAHILKAIVVYSNNNLESAYSSIKEALANNFEIDRNPFFMMIKGQIEFEMGSKEEGLKTLKKAYELPGVQVPEEKKTTATNRFMTIIEFNDNIRAQIFVYYAKALAADGQSSLAKEVMEAAIMEFAGTEEEPVVLMGNADIQIIAGDLKKALGILNSVEPNAKGYMEARKKLAGIYLNEMKQRRQYAKCYQDLAQAFPTFENIKLYGDALMKILEPEDAIRVYNQALELDEGNISLIREIGKAMAVTHRYQRALDYYEEKTSEFKDDHELKLDYIQLLTKSNLIDKAEQMLDINDVDEELEDNSFQNVKRRVRELELLALITKKKLEEDPLSETLFDELVDVKESVINVQFLAIERAKAEGGSPEQEKFIYAQHCEDLAELMMRTAPRYEDAVSYYQEAIKYNPNKSELILELAQIDYLQGNYDDAEAKAGRVLKADQGNPRALKLLGECLLVKGELEKGIAGFTKIYKRDNNNFIALGEMLIFNRYAGNLLAASNILKKVEARLGKTNDPGLSYCRGLMFYFRRNPNAALEQFNRARRNRVYEQLSLRYMVDIYLNPGQELIFKIKDMNSLVCDQGQINSLFSLIDKISDKFYFFEKAVLEVYMGIMIGEGTDEMESRLLGILGQDGGHVPALICLTLFRILHRKKVDKESLRKLSKVKFNPRWGDQCERGWIQVADYLINGKKPDMAERELKKTLKHNKSCWKAWEIIGELKEKEKNFQVAQNYYSQAWTVTEKQNCEIGYRLANLSFKAEDWVKSIAIGTEVKLF